MKRTTQLALAALVAAAAAGTFGFWFITNRRKLLDANRRKEKILKRKLRRKKETVVCVDSRSKWDDGVEAELLSELKRIPVLGLDCEWVSSAGVRRPVALLQLATQTGFCALIRLSKLDSVPDGLVDVLRDRTILKFGVGILDDAKLLLADYGLETRGCVDLRNVAARSRAHRPRIRAELRDGNGLGLKGLSRLILGKDVDKDSSVRCGDWEADSLSPVQIEYAANDALVAVDIFTELNLENLANKKHNKLTTTMAQLETLEAIFTYTAKAACQGILDSKYKASSEANSPRNVSRKQQPVPCGETSVKKLTGYSVRQNPLYHNCQLQAPDGQLLCTCDLKKAEWYIQKGLGVKVNDEPLVVRLTFEPSGRPQSDRNYYLHFKENVCVVCGYGESYIRKNVVPHEYRKYFPAVMKSHRSHDVLLMCVRCHHRSGIHDSIERQRLADRCSAPVGSEETSVKRNRQIVRVQSAAKALLNRTAKIPEPRLAALRKVVKDYCNVRELNDELLGAVLELDPNETNDDFVPHGKKVVEFVARNEGLIRFEREWRQHFIDTMKPRFLPECWSVDHSHRELEEYENRLKNSL
ncbi:exonuclease 3'-5' domain-containing protein 2-like [Tubulanus polymorphus]|uniref:exonuclease 3'-5' domain-containing protein 2-like n=1 Tax=Tubulanus polymorphus TaxID=672921 RepID=UPI003DA48F2A